MELVEIVDTDGNFTGQIIDKDMAHDQNLLHNEVAAFIINNKGQVLLQKRSANKRFNPNKWALCAGHVEAHENLESAMLREIKEEIGLDVSKSDLHQLGDKEIILEKSNSCVMYFYYVVANKKESDFTIQKEELSEAKWFSLEEIIDMIKIKDPSIVFSETRLKLFEQLRPILVSLSMS